MKYKNYKNPYTKEDRIYSHKEMLDMPLRELNKRKGELLSQVRILGIPSEKELRESENVIWVDEYTREDGTKVCGHWRSKPDGLSLNDVSGTQTGGAAKVDREYENKIELPKNNDEFFEKERNNPQSVLMRKNAEKNYERPDAKLFMDIALVYPQNVPSTKDYKFKGKEHVKELNKKYNLLGDKRIPSYYDGFEFSEESPTAQRLNNSEELKKEIFNEEKNYDSKTRRFKRDKLEIEFKNDQNLLYSFGHMTILEPKIENGYFTGIAYDKYNFEAMYGKKFQNVSQNIKLLNNKAYLLQTTSILRNYFIFVPIKLKI